MSKKIFILFGALFLILFLGNVSAADMCSFQLNSADCTGTSGGQVVMDLSSSTNAHGALKNQGAFLGVLCCNFGLGDTTCSSDDPNTNQPINKIIGLFSSTNAHAEAPDLASPNYNTDVCYDSLKYCSNVDTGFSCAVGEIEVVYISNITNAHIEDADLTPQNYDTKICCLVEYPTTCDLTSATWQYGEVMEGADIAVTVNGTDCGGKEISFEVFRGSTSCNSISGCENPPTAVFTAGSNSVTGTWNASPSHDNEYRFVAMVVTNPSETVISSLPNLFVNESVCDQIYYCADYTSENDCNPDSCEIAEASAPDSINCDDSNINCKCVWNSTTSKCTFGWEVTPSSDPCGNNVLDTGEACDGSILDGYSCTDFDEFTGGNLLCNSQCTGFITSSCTSYSCNNDGTRDVGEACDGNDLGGFSCADFDDFTGGNLLCNSACDFDTGQCIGGELEGSEIGICIYTQVTDDTCGDDGFLTFSWVAEFV